MKLLTPDSYETRSWRHTRTDLSWLAQVLINTTRQGESGANEKKYVLAVRMAPDDFNIPYDYANFTMLCREYKRSEELWKEAIRKGYAKPDGLVALAAVQLVRNKVQEAMDTLKKAYRKGCRSSSMYAIWYDAATRAKKPIKSRLDILREGLKHHPEDLTLCKEMGRLLATQGKYSAAAPYLMSAIGRTVSIGGGDELYFITATVLAECAGEGDSEAEKNLRKLYRNIVKLASMSSMLDVLMCRTLARIQAALGDEDAAKLALENALEMSEGTKRPAWYDEDRKFIMRILTKVRRRHSTKVRESRPEGQQRSQARKFKPETQRR